MKTRHLIAVLVAVLTLAACGNRHRAASVVDDFLKENLTNDDYKMEVVAMDKAAKVNAATLKALQGEAAGDPAFKKSIQWGTPATQDNYYYMRARIIHEQDTMVKTFYLDDQLTTVVAFKQN